MTTDEPVTIDQLRARGFKVHVQHFRIFEMVPQQVCVSLGAFRKATHAPGWSADLARMIPDCKLSSRGGGTQVDIQKDGEVIASGIARCNPIDNYVKRTGRGLALERALASVDGELL